MSAFRMKYELVTKSTGFYFNSLLFDQGILHGKEIHDDLVSRCL